MHAAILRAASILSRATSLHAAAESMMPATMGATPAPHIIISGGCAPARTIIVFPFRHAIYGVDFDDADLRHSRRGAHLQASTPGGEYCQHITLQDADSFPTLLASSGSLSRHKHGLLLLSILAARGHFSATSRISYLASP